MAPKQSFWSIWILNEGLFDLIANSTSSHWNVDASELISPWPSPCSKVKLILPRLTSSSAHPKPVYEDTATDYCRLRRRSGASSVRIVKYWKTSSTSNQKTVGPPMVRNLSCSTCVISVPIHWKIFSLLLAQTIYVLCSIKYIIVIIINAIYYPLLKSMPSDFMVQHCANCYIRIYQTRDFLWKRLIINGSARNNNEWRNCLPCLVHRTSIRGRIWKAAHKVAE